MMRRLFSILIFLALGISWVSTATAKTDFSFQTNLVLTNQIEGIVFLQEILEALETQITVIQEQIAEITQQIIILQAGSSLSPQAPAETVPEVQAQVLFSVPLFLDMRNEDVRRLQKFLAQDQEIYPEGLVTGYFGFLTLSAVIRFQEKYADEILKPIGLPSGTGFVGDKTLAKLNELYAASTPSFDGSLAQEEPALEEQTEQPLSESEKELLSLDEESAVEEEEVSDTSIPLTGGGGGGGGGSPSLTDTIAPSAITNLAVFNPTTSSIDLSWTAPGDDGTSGTAVSYDVRYATSNIITDENWAVAIQATVEPTPQAAGTTETMTISGLSSSTTYYFAMKTSDEVSNESVLSNVVSGTTSSPPPPPPPPPQCSDLISGKQTYFVSMNNSPTITQVDLALELPIGVPQVVTVKARDSNPITAVSATIQTDNESNTFPLSLIDGTDENGTWEGLRTVTDTHCNIYSAIVSATSDSGTSSIELSFR